MNWIAVFGISSVAFVALAAYLYHCAFVLSCACVACGVCCAHVAWLRPARSHNIRTLLSQYTLRTICITLGFFYDLYYRTTVNNCKRTQEQLLLKYLDENRNTQYARDTGLDRVHSTEELKRVHPLIDNYEMIKHYVDRICKGEKNIFTREDVGCVAMTSGTTGKNKRYPYVKSFKTRLLPALALMLKPYYLNYTNLKRLFQFRLFPPDRRTECGLPVAGFGAFFTPYSFGLVPACRSRIPNDHVSLYVQAVFLLAEREVCLYEGFSSNLAYIFFKFMANHVDELCADIETGCVRPMDGLEEDIRQELNLSMRPDPARANEVRRAFSLGPAGLACRLWPDLRAMMLATTGNFAHCAGLLAGGVTRGVPFVITGMGSTEGYLGVNHEPALVRETYVFTHNVTFFEFIHVDDAGEKNPPTCLLHEVESGQCYEPVITTYNGFYRLRTGDVVQVVGPWEGTVPKFVYKYRLSQCLTIAYERTDEALLYQALRASGGRCWPGHTLLDYTSTESMVLDALSGKKNDIEFYVIFTEFDSTDKVILDSEIEEQVDEQLCNIHEAYDVYRKKGSTGMLRLLQVRCGTFDRVRQTICGDVTNQQFKMPRVVRREELLRVLWDGLLPGQLY